MFSPEDVIEINKLIGGTGQLVKPAELESAFACVLYEDTELLALCSIVRSIMQNHPFVDGNKRTGCFMLMAGASLLGYSVSQTDEEWVQFAIDSVIERWSPIEISEFVTRCNTRL